jgi:hypothetical protein
MAMVLAIVVGVGAFACLHGELVVVSFWLLFVM